MILLDTHVLVWLVAGSDRLGNTAKRRCDEAARSQSVLVSAITFWEVAALARRNRIQLASSPAAWREGVLRAGVTELALDGAIAIEAPSLPDFHADPADQFIVVSAIKSGATLITADERILKWPGRLPRQDARL